MKNLFKEAHKMTREIKKEFNEVDYKAQFAICLSYLHNNKEEKNMRIDEMIKKYGLEIAFRNGEKGVTFKGNLLKEEIIELKENKAEIIKELENRKERINKYFEELDNVEIYCLHYTHYYISKETKGYKEMKELDKEHFGDVEAKWLRENKKYFVETDRKVEVYEDDKIFYVYTKENAAEKENKKAECEQVEENTGRFAELCKMAERMSNVEFEDVTGLPREHYLNI